MPSFEEQLKSLVIKLHEIDALKFGDFKMKVGINSPVYFDLRVIVSYPSVMDTLSKLLWEFSKSNIDCQHICGVPYTALPIASLISVYTGIPMLIRRKETKDYGTRKLIEGKFQKGDTCVIIEDVVTSGSSILETFRDLKNEGLTVSEAIVVVDRQQGGNENLQQNGLKMRSLCTLSQIMDILQESGKVNQATVDQVQNYISSTQIPLKGYLEKPKLQGSASIRLQLDFKERANKAKNVVAKKLLHLMSEKKTNLCLSADSRNSEKILELASVAGPHICILKIHADIVTDFSETFVKKLVDISQKENFLIMEDRKFSDIGHISSLQYSQGLYNIVSWADIVTVHPVSGPDILQGLSDVVENNLERGCFLVVEMSSKENLNNPQYQAGAMKFAEMHSKFIAGVVCQTPSLVTDPGMIQLTPGVQLQKGKDKLGQQYNTPEHVILSLGADVAVVGRGITEANDVRKAATEFQSCLWEAYEKRIISCMKE